MNLMLGDSEELFVTVAPSVGETLQLYVEMLNSVAEPSVGKLTLGLADTSPFAPKVRVLPIPLMVAVKSVPSASAPGTSEQTMTIAMNSDSSLRFIDFIKYPSFLMSGGTRPTGQAAMAACRISLRPYYTTRLWKVRIETVSFLHHFLIPAALRAFQPGPMVYWTEKRGGRFPGEGDFFWGGVSPPRSRTPPTAAREAIF